MKRPIGLRIAVFLATSSAGACMFDLSGCASTIGANFNPCGTIFPTTFCDPVAWDNMFIKVQDFERDPTCTVATLCGPWPTAPGTATNTTTTTTGTTGTTGTTTGTGFGF